MPYDQRMLIRVETPKVGLGWLGRLLSRRRPGRERRNEGQDRKPETDDALPGEAQEARIVASHETSSNENAAARSRPTTTAIPAKSVNLLN
jgi:hypothetical protein